METASPVEVVFARAARALRPPPRLTISQWADRERKLSPESSAEPGQWYTSRAEYQRGIMDAVCDPANAQTVLMTSGQTGKTESAINNPVGFYVSQDPSPILVVQPTLEMGEAWSKDRLAPMVRDTPCLVGTVAEPNSKGSGNTLLHKVFAGGHITIAGANSPASLASRPIRILLMDEIDRYPPSAGTEGDPVSLAIKRTANFWNRRIVMASTPTVKGASRIEQAFAHSDKRYFFVPCPHCKAFHALRWKAVQWTGDDPDTARIACESCGSLLDDADRIDMIAGGEWRATAPFRGVAGFHLWEAYSPWRTLAEIVESFLKAKPYPETLKAWINTTLGEPWEDQTGERIAADTIASRAENYTQWTVPEGALLLAAGVDVQHDRLALTLWGFGQGEEAWAIAWEEIFGSPLLGSTWNKLDEVLMRRFPHELGGEIGISAACVDAGDGATMGYVLDYARDRVRRQSRRVSVLAIKGQSQPGKLAIGRPTKVEVSQKGVVLPGSALLWPVGSDTVKHWLAGRLKSASLVHFPSDMPADFYAQLTAERLVTKHTHGVAVKTWVKASGVRNEALDATLYAYAAAVWAGLKRANWALLRARVVASEVVAEPEDRPTRIVPLRPRGFVKGWKSG